MRQKTRHKLYPAAAKCSDCKGGCCLRCPGPYHPTDFPESISTKYLLELLERGITVIDWKQENGRATYFLRPPSYGDNGHYFNSNPIRGECTFFTQKGCSLPVGSRPLGCLNLKPGPGLSCKATFTQYKAFRSWARHRKVLEEVRSILERRSKGDFS